METTIKQFLCDVCGKIKIGNKHKMYDENWNLISGCYECDDCFKNRLNTQISDDDGLEYK